MPCRGIRGATTASENTPEAIMEATQELLRAITAANNVQLEDIASAIFTVTPDLNAAFAPRAAREMGWNNVPLLSAVEVESPTGLPLCVRVLIHWNTERPPYDIRHIYLRAATKLRPDLLGEFALPEPVKETLAAAQPAKNGAAAAWGMENVAYQGEPGANGQRVLVFREGAFYEFPVSGPQGNISRFEQAEYPLPTDAATGSRYRRKATDTQQLLTSSRLDDIAELQWRLSTPLSTVLLALAGVPLSKSNPRRGKYAKIGVAIVIFAIYYQLFVIAKTWVEKAVVVPWVGIWWVPFLMAVCSAAVKVASTLP